MTASVTSTSPPRALREELHEADGPVGERADVLAHHHHLVADRLYDAGVVGKGGVHALHEALHEGERLLLALLFGEAGVAGKVGECDRHPQAAELLLAELDLHVADHVLLDVMLEEAL